MLVLSRKRDESIVIDAVTPHGIPCQISVTVVEVRGDKVRLGVEAPREVPVHRREVYDAIQRQTSQSSAEAAPSPHRIDSTA